MSMKYSETESAWTASLDICENSICPMMGALHPKATEAIGARSSMRQLVALVLPTLLASLNLFALVPLMWTVQAVPRAAGTRPWLWHHHRAPECEDYLHSQLSILSLMTVARNSAMSSWTSWNPVFRLDWTKQTEIELNNLPVVLVRRVWTWRKAQEWLIPLSSRSYWQLFHP